MPTYIIREPRLGCRNSRNLLDYTRRKVKSLPANYKKRGIVIITTIPDPVAGGSVV